ncbi:MAG: B12-binding domain-containing radical SAM protein [Bacteroidales bacterium]
MKKLKISIIDLLHNRPSPSLYRRYMFPNHASIMPQVIAVWCRQEGHEVDYSIYTGSQNVFRLVPDGSDMVIFSAFSFTAQLAYALSAYYRSMGIVTVLGGPHARSFPEDACRYFDYVLGLTDRELIRDLLHQFERSLPEGKYLSCNSQPKSIPGVRERWDFIKKIHRSSPLVKGVSMIGSFGCPYQCDFCIDADIPYQALDMESIREDLQFIPGKIKHPVVGWYDPNFGIRFNAMMDTIESTVPPGSIRFIAECNLSTLTEPNVKRLQRNGFKMMMPGIESWFGYGKKAKMEYSTGMDKVIRIAEQVNMIQQYIPQVHTNLMFGFDTESGPEPFTLTKRFVDLAPGIFPAYALFTVFGQHTTPNVRSGTERRFIPFPFHMMHGLNNLNVIPANYTWDEFYTHFLDLLKYSFSSRAMYRRFTHNPMIAAKWFTLFMSFSVGASGKISQVAATLKNLRTNKEFRAFMEKETDRIPSFMVERVRKDLGPLWEWLPDKTMSIHPPAPVPSEHPVNS